MPKHLNWLQKRIKNFVPWGIMAADPEYLKQLPVTEELKKSNLWSVKSVNVTSVDW